MDTESLLEQSVIVSVPVNPYQVQSPALAAQCHFLVLTESLSDHFYSLEKDRKLQRLVTNLALIFLLIHVCLDM